MSSDDLRDELAKAQDTIRALEEELEHTSRGMMALTVELEQAEEKYRSIFENAIEGIFQITGDGRRYLTVNPAMARILGYLAPEELLESVTDVSSQVFADSSGFAELLRTVTERGVVTDHDCRWRRKDGTRTWVSVSLRAVCDGEGRHQRYEGSAQDITERRRAEEGLKAAMVELKRSNAELEQFAYVASHDLQHPLRMVSSYVQLLARRYEGQLDDDADQFIGFAVGGAKRMQTLINDLLMLSRVGTRGKEPAPTCCDTVLNRAIENLQVAVAESDATITHDPLPMVVGDETQLIQLFQNLIGNAIKFRGDDLPRVHISAKSIEESTIPGPQSDIHNGWVLSVRDNGIGIDQEHAERIFMVFQRLHTQEEYDGTGIGLAVCKKIVERHGGRIWIESQAGEGTTFYFTLPRPE